MAIVFRLAQQGHIYQLLTVFASLALLVIASRVLKQLATGVLETILYLMGHASKAVRVEHLNLITIMG